MDKATTLLMEWLKSYIKNKDLIIKEIIEITEEGNNLIVKFRDKTTIFLIRPFMDNFNPVFERTETENITLVTFNTKEHFNMIVRNWKKLSKYAFLKMILVNPFSYGEKNWIISPHVHDKISEESSLKQGLRSMYETVPELSREQVLES